MSNLDDFADGVGFEPTRQVSPPTIFPGLPLQPLEQPSILFFYFNCDITISMAARTGFEPVSS